MTLARLTPAFALMAASLLAMPTARADAPPPKAALCAACHGRNGVPANPSIPVIAGQNEGYLYVELRDYKLGNRKNAAMNAVAATLDKPTMQALAAWFAAQPWPELEQPRAPADVAHRAEVIAGSAACKGCHLDHWQGNSVTPRLGDQSLQYLRDTMEQFRDGQRTNNPWMAALLKTYSNADINALAEYLTGY